jgi:hypothetical protein
VEADLYKYLMKNIVRRAKFLSTWGLSQMYFPGLYLTLVHGGFLHLKPTAGCQISILIFEICLVDG